jgi:hypothetical protein
MARTVGTLFKKNASKLVRAAIVNGLPGFVTLETDSELQTTALDTEDGRIAAIYEGSKVDCGSDPSPDLARLRLRSVTLSHKGRGEDSVWRGSCEV